MIRLVGLIPAGKFTTYGSIAIHMNVMARHVAFVMSSLTAEESATLPWHRVVSADARPIFARGGGIHCITQQQPTVTT